MKKVFNCKSKTGSRKANEPRLVGSIASDMLQVWNNDTLLGVDLKTQLRSDRRMRAGKNYQGVMRRDVTCEEFLYEEHFTFTETMPQTAKRNPQVYKGEYVTITRRDDGTYHPNLRPVTITDGFRVEKYATAVANELLWALEGLVGEE